MKKWIRIFFSKTDKEENQKKEIKEVLFFFQENHFLERRQFRKSKFNKKTQEGDEKTTFLKSWGGGYFFMTGRDYHKGRSARSLTFSAKKKSVGKDVFQS